MIKNNKILNITMAFVVAILLTACGPSEEKLAEVQVALTALENARTVAEETYGNLIDSSYKDQLDQLAEASDSYAALEYDKMKDEDIDEVLPTINDLASSYESIESELLEIAQKEKDEAEAEGRYIDIQGYITNKTGKTITGIVLRDDSENTESDNLILNGIELGNSETLMGVVLNVYMPTSSWSVIITTSEGESYVSNVENIDEKSLFGMTLGTISEEGTFEIKLEDYATSEDSSETNNSSEEDSSADEASTAISTEDATDEASSDSSN